MNKNLLISIKEKIESVLADNSIKGYPELISKLSNIISALSVQIEKSPIEKNEISGLLQIFESLWYKKKKPETDLSLSTEQKERINMFLQDIQNVQEFLLAFANGDLSKTLRSKGVMAGSIKSLQANLRHLTWQTQAIAKGDYTQKVDFMGEFSTAFNSMVDCLNETRESLHKNMEELRELIQMKDRLFSIIGHDLRGPIGNLKLMMESILQSDSSKSEADLRKSLELMKHSSGSAFDLLENLLNWARSQQKLVEFKTSPQNLKEIVDENINLLASTAKNKFITLKNEIESPVIVQIDKNSISTVIRNLISNALKFTQADGLIIISCEKFDNHIEVNIRDSGIGMSPESVDRLFKKNQIFTTRGTKGEKGTGLGLLLCRDFVEGNKGKIWVESEVGKGSIFKFTLAYGIQGEKEDLSSLPYIDYSNKIREINGARILLAEDDEINQQIAQEILHKSGLKVEIAETGEIALDMVKKSGNPSNYDMVLMDLHMPMMDGYIATKEIRKIKGYEYLPVVAMTAEVGDGIKEECQKAGMNDYITKPINSIDLFQILIKHIKSGKKDLGGIPEKNCGAGESYPDFPELNGIDIQDGLARLGGNKKLYLNLLEKYYENNKKIVENIKSAVKEDQRELAERFTHTLKGVSANLGAKEVQSIAARLESNLKIWNLDENNALFEDLSEALGVVLKSIGEYKKLKETDDKSNVTEDTSPLNKEKILAILGELKKLLEENDRKAIDKVEELNKEPGIKILKEGLNKMLKLIIQYDFEEAMQLLNSMVSKLQ